MTAQRSEALRLLADQRKFFQADCAFQKAEVMDLPRIDRRPVDAAGAVRIKDGVFHPCGLDISAEIQFGNLTELPSVDSPFRDPQRFPDCPLLLNIGESDRKIAFRTVDIHDRDLGRQRFRGRGWGFFRDSGLLRRFRGKAAGSCQREESGGGKEKQQGGRKRGTLPGNPFEQGMPEALFQEP